MRGNATCTSLSKKSYMRSRRNVTMAPTTMPSRILKLEIDFFAFVRTGFCPVIRVSVATATSTYFLSCKLFESPTFSTIFLRCGTARIFERFSSFESRGAIFSLYSFRKRVILIDFYFTFLANTTALCPFPNEIHPCRLAAFRANDHHLTDRQRRCKLDALSFFAATRRAHVLKHFIHVLDNHLVVFRQYLNHLAGLTLVLPGEYFHGVVDFNVKTHTYSTSGANDRMRVKPWLRSSRATGPKIRVPFGSLLFLSIRTTALSSK